MTKVPLNISTVGNSMLVNKNLIGNVLTPDNSNTNMNFVMFINGKADPATQDI